MGGMPIKIISDVHVIINTIKEKHPDFITKKKPALSVHVIKGKIKLPFAKSKGCYYFDKKKQILQVNHHLIGRGICFFKQNLIKLECRRGEKYKRTYKEFILLLIIIFKHYIIKNNKGFLLHSAALIKDNKFAVLFPGPSKSGKSYISRYLNKSQKYKLINDDYVLVREKKNKVFVYGTLFTGKEDTRPYNLSSEIKVIYFLEPSKENKITPLTSQQCFLKLLADSTTLVAVLRKSFLIKKNLGFMKAHFKMIRKLMSKTKSFELRRNNNSRRFYDKIFLS